jgi:hypothetical protein
LHDIPLRAVRFERGTAVFVDVNGSNMAEASLLQPKPLSACTSAQFQDG